MATRKVLKKIIKNAQVYELPSADDFVDLESNQTVGWTKTFTTSPVVPNKSGNAWDNPTTIATEKQVKNVADSVSTLDWSVVKKTWDQTIAWTKTFSTAPVIPSASTLPSSPSNTKPATEWQLKSVKDAIPVVDSAMSDSSTNTIQNKIVKAYIDSAIWGITWIDFQVVESLPATWTKGVIYLMNHWGSAAQNIYDEYIWITSSSSYELIWTTAVDLSNYVDKTSNQTIWWTKTFSTSPVVPSKTSDAWNNPTAIATEAQVAKKLDTDDLWNATVDFKHLRSTWTSMGSLTTNQSNNWSVVVPWDDFVDQDDYDALPSTKASDNNSYWIYDEVEE